MEPKCLSSSMNSFKPFIWGCATSKVLQNTFQGFTKHLFYIVATVDSIKTKVLKHKGVTISSEALLATS